MSAADAAALVADLESGAVTVNDLLGRLYNQGKSPEISIPRGGTAPAVVAPEYAMAPADCEHVTSAISHVGPKTHFPPLKDKRAPAHFFC